MQKVDTFANRLRTAMVIRGIRQSELARISGIARANISSYLIGRYEANSVRTYQLAQVLGVSPIWLMGLDSPMEEQFTSTRDKVEAQIKMLSDEQLEKLLRFMKDFL